MKEIVYINQCQTEYGTIQTDLQSWLTAKPDVSNLLGIQKTIKGLKSKLRHKLADKEDLEEVNAIRLPCNLTLSPIGHSISPSAGIDDELSNCGL